MAQLLNNKRPFLEVGFGSGENWNGDTRRKLSKEVSCHLDDSYTVDLTRIYRDMVTMNEWAWYFDAHAMFPSQSTESAPKDGRTTTLGPIGSG